MNDHTAGEPGRNKPSDLEMRFAEILAAQGICGWQPLVERSGDPAFWDIIDSPDRPGRGASHSPASLAAHRRWNRRLRRTWIWPSVFLTSFAWLFGAEIIDLLTRQVLPAGVGWVAALVVLGFGYRMASRGRFEVALVRFAYRARPATDYERGVVGPALDLAAGAGFGRRDLYVARAGATCDAPGRHAVVLGADAIWILEHDPSAAPLVAAVMAFAVSNRGELCGTPTLATDAWLVPGAAIYRFLEGFFSGCVRTFFFWLPPVRNHARTLFSAFVAVAFSSGAFGLVRDKVNQGNSRELAGGILIACFMLIAAVAVIVSSFCRARLLRSAQAAADRRVAESSLREPFLRALNEAGIEGRERAYRLTEDAEELRGRS